MQRLFEDLLYKYKVDIALWAHYHLYERTCKVYKSECVDDGIMHIVVGSGGYLKSPNLYFEKKWSLYHRTEYGYGRVTVANKSAIHWEWVQNTYNKVMDSLWLFK